MRRFIKYCCNSLALEEDAPVREVIADRVEQIGER
jgi:hypothetical protein